MRRNALKNRKISQTQRWRREKHRLSGQHPLKSSSLGQRRTLPLLSSVTLRELRIRVRRHSVDFLLHCKDPKSKERALLLQLEEVAKEDIGQGNLKPLTLTSTVSGLHKSRTAGRFVGLNGTAVTVVTRRTDRKRNSLRTRSTGALTHPEQTQSSDTETAVCVPVEMDDTCRSEKQETVDRERDNNNNNSNSGGGSESSNTTAESADTIKPSNAEGDKLTDRSKRAADNPLKSLKQYLTVSLTRLSMPHLMQAAERRRSAKAETARPPRRACRSKPTQEGSTEVCSTEGSRGVREMLFKPVDRANSKKRLATEPVGNLAHKDGDERVIAIQTPSQDTDDVEKEQMVKEPEEKGKAAATVLECKSKESECKKATGDKPGGQNDKGCARNKVKEACREEGVVKPPEQTAPSVNKPPTRRLEEDIVIKQAKVLLSDILRKDDSLIDKRLHGGAVGRSLGCLASEERRRVDGGEEGAEINGGRYHCSVQRRIMRQRKARPGAPETKAEGSQSAEARSSGEAPTAASAESSKDAAQLPLSPLRQNGSPTTCSNPLPHDSPISAKATSGLQPDGNLQAHIQSNIPLKKRTFRSSVEADAEQGLNPASREGTEVNPCPDAKQEGVATFPGEGATAKKGGRKRVRRTELQRLGPRKVMAFNRGLRLRANEGQRSHLLRRVRKCKLEKRDRDDAEAQAPGSERHSEEKQAEVPAEIQQNCVKNQSHECQPKDASASRVHRGELEETNPAVNLKILFRRRKGSVWEMQGAGFEDMALKLENGEQLVTCDPFKAIMDSVSVLNMEMEAAQAHVHASKKSKHRLLRLKRRGERLFEKKTVSASADVKPDTDGDKVLGSAAPTIDGVELKQKLEKDPAVTVGPLPEKTDSGGDVMSAVGQEPKVEDRFLSSCCLFECGSQQKVQSELNDVTSLPVIKLRRKNEDIWEVDSKEELRQNELKAECDIKREVKGHVLGKQKRGCFDFGKFRDECPPSQRPNSIAHPFKTESPPFSLSLSPLSLSSPLNDGRTEVISLAADSGSERPEMNSGGRKQRHKMERAHKCGPVETPTTCLSHTLQQIDNSLSRLSEGLCSSQTLEKSSACPVAANSVIQPPSQSPPFATADSMLSGEPSFTNCCDDILDFPCLNFEGYYQPQNMLPSSPSDLCSLDPPTDPFSSPLSHSPSDTWTTETPYLGPPSPGNNFTSDDLQFFPGLISAKSDSVPLECEAKDPPRDKNPLNPTFGFSALGNSDMTAKDRVICKNPGMRQSREEVRAQPVPVVNKPRIFSTTSPIAPQCPVNTTQPPFCVKAGTSQSKAQSSLKTYGPFHRMVIPNKSPSFGGSQSNTVRGMSQNCLTKTVPTSQTPNKFLSPQLFSVKNPNPPDNPFKVQTSTVIHRVLKFQGGNPSPNLYSAPCKDTRTFGANGEAPEKSQQSHKLGIGAESHHKGNIWVQGFGRDVDHLTSPGRPNNPYFNKPNSSFPQSVNKMSSNKPDALDANMVYKNFSTLPRSFFPSKGCDSYSSPQEKTFRHDKPTSDKHQPCYTQQDPFDFSFGSSLSPISQDNSPHMMHGTPPGTPAPANKSQSSSSSASFPYGYQGPPYVLNFSGDHSLTLGLRDGAEGCPGLGPTNYTYHCLMEPSGTQGRLVLEPCGPQFSNPASFSLGGFSGLKGQDEHCRKDMQQQCQPGEHHQGPQHYGATTSHSMGGTKPKRVRLVVTDGTVDLDLQYSD